MTRLSLCRSRRFHQDRNALPERSFHHMTGISPPTADAYHSGPMPLSRIKDQVAHTVNHGLHKFHMVDL